MEYPVVAENGRFLFHTAPAPGQLRRPVLLAIVHRLFYFFISKLVLLFF